MFSTRTPLSGEVVGASVFFGLAAFKSVESGRESGVRSCTGGGKSKSWGSYWNVALLLCLAKCTKLKDRSVQAKGRYHVVLEGR